MATPKKITVWSVGSDPDDKVKDWIYTWDGKKVKAEKQRDYVSPPTVFDRKKGEYLTPEDGEAFMQLLAKTQGLATYVKIEVES